MYLFLIFILSTGLLDVDDPMIMGEEDEVLLELQKRQEELKALYAHNRTQKQRLVKLAKEEIKRQELRQKLRAADNEVSLAFHVQSNKDLFLEAFLQ